MSGIGILNDPLSIAFVLLIIGSPGLPLGAIAGALVWRRHRVEGAQRNLLLVANFRRR